MVWYGMVCYIWYNVAYCILQCNDSFNIMILNVTHYYMLYVMMSYSTSHFNILLYLMFCELSSVDACDIIALKVMLYNDRSWFVRFVSWDGILSCYIISFYITSNYIILRHIISKLSTRSYISNHNWKILRKKL